jgi:hypothetical protein
VPTTINLFARPSLLRHPSNAGNIYTVMNDAQIAFLVLYTAYIFIILIFHNTLVCYPFRLLTTFLHEISHAIACWISCGDVHKIRVFDNEGGVTQYVGGCRVLIIPAGYVGSAMWGSLFVMLSGGRKTATGVAGTLIVMLLWSLCYAPNKTMIYLNLFYAVFTSIFIYLEWRVFTPILNYIVLFYGAFVGIHAIFDTYQDTIKRTVLRSDAYACYEQVSAMVLILELLQTLVSCLLTSYLYPKPSARAVYRNVLGCSGQLST